MFGANSQLGMDSRFTNTKPFETLLPHVIGSVADLLEAYGLQQAARCPKAPPSFPDFHGCGEGAALEGKGPHWDVESLGHAPNRMSLPKLPPIEHNDQSWLPCWCKFQHQIGFEKEQKPLLAAGHRGATSPTLMSPSIRSPSSIRLST